MIHNSLVKISKRASLGIKPDWDFVGNSDKDNPIGVIYENNLETIVHFITKQFTQFWRDSKSYKSTGTKPAQSYW